MTTRTALTNIENWAFKWLSHEQASRLKPVIEYELNYSEGLRRMALSIGEIIPVIVNRYSMRVLNPVVLETYLDVGNDYIPVLYVSIRQDSEIIASLAVNGGMDAFLSPTPKDPKAVIAAMAKLPAELFGVVAPNDYIIDVIDQYLGDTPDENKPYEAKPTVDLKPVTLDNQYDIPTLDIDQQITESPTMESWVAWGSRPHSEPKHAVHFYVEDKKFSSLASEPEKLIKSAPSMAIEVNYSTNPMQPRALVIYNTWQKRTLSRLWQSLGIRIAVDMCVTREFLPLNLLGVPRGWKAYANRAYSGDMAHLFDAFELAKLHAGTEDILYFVYGRETARQVCEANNWQWIDSAMFTYGQ